MRSIAVLIILIEVLMIPADAVTEARSFGSSDIISISTNISNAKTVLQGGVSTSDLNFGFAGELNSAYNFDREGIYGVKQGIWASLNNTRGINGLSNWSISYSGAKIAQAQTAYSGNMKYEFLPNRYYTGSNSETSAFATSDGTIGEYSAISKTFLDSNLSNPVIMETPDPTYNFRTQGQLGAEFLQTCNGTYQMYQGITTSPDNYWGLHGREGFYSTFYKTLEGKSGFFNSQHNTFSGGQATSSKMRSYGTITVGFPNVKNSDQSKAQILEANSTFEWNLDRPMDLFKQDLALNFRSADDQIAYSGYDVTREMAIGDIDCISEMELVYPNS